MATPSGSGPARHAPTTVFGHFDPFDPDTLQCPFPHYAAMRADAPVLFLEQYGVHLVTRHDLVMEVLRDPQTYSSRFGATSMPLPADERARMVAVFAEGYRRVPTMLTADMPEHTRYRRLVAKAFHPQAIAALEPVIRRVTVELIESWIDAGRIEFVRDFAVPLPVRVIAHALNVPDERLADFKRWSDDSIAGIGTNISIDARVEAERGVNEFQHYFAEQLERRRTEPLDDLLANLLNARIEDDDPDVEDTRPLDVPEMLSIIQQLLVAGNETTTKMLTEMMRLLGEHPEQWRRLRVDPGRIDQVVEETLRWRHPRRACGGSSPTT
jgi:cytochrome P450